MEKKNNVLKIVLAALIIVTVVVLVIVFIPKDTALPSSTPELDTPFSFELSGEFVYKIQTDTRWLTMQNDGGSHTDVYYCFDLDKQLVIKVSESYHANLGSTPKTTTKVIYEKNLDHDFSESLKMFWEDLIVLQDIRDENNYNCFSINKSGLAKDIFNTSTIDTIKEMLNKIDNL